MADSDVQVPDVNETAVDVEMEGAEIDDAGAANDGNEADKEDEVVVIESPARVTFIDLLKSPIVEIAVGSGNEVTILSAHQALLVRSPLFAEACEQFNETDPHRRIELATEPLDAVGCFLQYLYTGEYFPRKLDESRGLEVDPSIPVVDESGEQLLKHARVYTLADKLGLADLKTLAHSKIHRINSTARGEIAYARFVYASTPREDTTIRKPVAAFWAHRSHVLRHEAEDEFRKMCLEFPQFGFDVLSLVLDAKEKGQNREHPGEKSSRKRQRTSQV